MPVNIIPPNAFWWQLRGVTLLHVCAHERMFLHHKYPWDTQILVKQY